jgi:hypothetical protein
MVVPLHVFHFEFQQVTNPESRVDSHFEQRSITVQLNLWNLLPNQNLINSLIPIILNRLNNLIFPFTNIRYITSYVMLHIQSMKNTESLANPGDTRGFGVFSYKC